MAILNDKSIEELKDISPKAKNVVTKKKASIDLSGIESLVNEETQKKPKRVKKETLNLSALDSVTPQQETVAPKKKKSSVMARMNQYNANSSYSYTVSENHISILFNNAKLLSVNELFSILQSSKFNLYNYKTTCRNMIFKVLREIHEDCKSKGEAYPFFDCNAEVILYRRGDKLVDTDAISTMFKYIVDAFKYNDNKLHDKYNPYGVLKDDNPLVIQHIEVHSKEGLTSFGIQIKRSSKPVANFEAEDILVYKP